MFFLDLMFLAFLLPGVPMDEQPGLPPTHLDFSFVAVEEIEEALLPVVIEAQQEHLADLGWYEGEVDAIRGPLTERAIEEFTEAADVEPSNWLELLDALRDDDAPHAPEPEPTPAPEVSTRDEVVVADTSSDGRYGVGEPWATLAECESGNWINGGASFESGSARWHWAKPGTSVPSWGTRIHHGGLQFHPGTWSAYRSDHHPTYAYDATPQQQVEVAIRVQAAQGWRAWPVCSRKVGLR